MWCVIPAAGRGTRMRGYAAGRPKALVELDGRTVIDRLLEVLPDAVTGVCVIVPAGDGTIAEHVRAIDTDRVLCTSPQAEPLGVADAVYRAHECVHGPFLTLMGDAFFSASLGGFVEGWLAGGADGAVLTESRLESDRGGMGLVEIAGGDVVRVWKGRPEKEAVRVAGAFILPPEFFEEYHTLSVDAKPEIEIEEVITSLLSGGYRFGAVPYDGWRRNINTPEDMALVERHLAGAG